MNCNMTVLFSSASLTGRWVKVDRLVLRANFSAYSFCRSNTSSENRSFSSDRSTTSSIVDGKSVCYCYKNIPDIPVYVILVAWVREVNINVRVVSSMEDTTAVHMSTNRNATEKQVDTKQWHRRCFSLKFINIVLNNSISYIIIALV